MRRRSRVILAAALLAVACGSSPARDGDPGHAGIPIARRIDFASAGSGTPIVLQAGLGDGRDTWRPVWNDLARIGRAVAYSRPGYRGSDAAARPRDPCTIARELRALLREHDVQPPYVLVGHSLGGLYQWVYAALYPDDVKALVLLDPTHPEHWARLQRDARGTAMTIRTARVLFTPTMRAEFDAQHDCLDTLDRTRARTVPARLLVRSEYEVVELGAFRTTIEALQAEWLELAAAPGIERVRGASHYVHRDRPEVVVRAVRDVLR